MASIFWKIHIDSKHKQFTFLQWSHNWMFYLFWTVGDTLKSFLLCLITNYRLIFLWKAQMVAIIAPPPPPFQYGKSLLKSKKKKLICYETAFWIKICRQIQNGGNYRQISCNKTLENDVLELLCPHACLFYRVIFSLDIWTV